MRSRERGVGAQPATMGPSARRAEALSSIPGAAGGRLWSGTGAGPRQA